LNKLVRSDLLNSGPRNLASRNWKHRSLSCVTKCVFAVLGKCGGRSDRQTDGQTDGQRKPPRAKIMPNGGA